MGINSTNENLKQKPISQKKYDKEYYEKYNHGYDEYLKSKDLIPELKAKIEHLDFTNKIVLDIACGRGEFVRYAVLKGAQSYGIDYSEASIEISKDLMNDLPENIKKNIHLEVMDAKKLVFEDNLFDYIVMFDIVEHLHDWELKECLAEVKRILKPDGKLFIHTSPNKYMMDVIRMCLKPWKVDLKSSEYHVNEHTYFLMKKYTSEFIGDVILEKDKNYWSKQMVFRSNIILKLAQMLDYVLDSKPINYILSTFPVSILSCTDIWFIGEKKMKLNISKEQEDKLELILSKVGDLNFKRRIMTMLEYMDIQPGDKILDMGCGEGFYSAIFDQLYDCEVTAVDYDPSIMAMAKEWLKDSKKVKFEHGDICNLRFKDNTFDKIVCTEVLEHIVDDVKATQELYRVLKPKGKLAVTVPNANYPLVWDPVNKIREGLGLGHFNPLNGFWGGIWAYDHKRLYNPEDLKGLLENEKFKVQDLKVLTHHGVPFNHLVLYTGKMFYTKLPVSEDIKNSMEKFKWDEVETKKSFVQKVISSGLAFLTWVDSFNDKDFPLETSAMAVAALAQKE